MCGYITILKKKTKSTYIYSLSFLHNSQYNIKIRVHVNSGNVHTLNIEYLMQKPQ